VTARLTLQPVAPTPVNTTFGVSGSFLLVPNFTYQNNNGPKRSLPTGSTVPTSLTGSFAFIHPAFTTVGIYNVRVVESTTGASATIPVTIVAAPPPITSGSFSIAYSPAHG